MAFQRSQTVTEITFVMLEGAGEVLMATRHLSTAPLGLGVQPTEDAFLQLG